MESGDNMRSRILVTGSSGTIGTRLCEKLLEENYAIIGVDLKPNRWNDRINKLTIIGDLRDKETFKNLPKDVDLVVHLAANARVYNLVVDPSLARDNFEILFNTLEFCRRNDIKRFIFASSREVYGNSNQIVHSENEAYVRNCESPYAASKIGGEALVHAYQQCYGINFIIIRFSNVYGMYDDSDRVIPLFIKLAKENRDLVVYGKEKLLDFTYIDDAISGVLKCIENFDQVKNDVFNIASGKAISIVELAQLIRKYMHSKSKIVIKESRTGEVMKFIADISKAKEKLGYEPKTTIDEGIKKSIKWYVKGVYNE
ncbi:MAG TPA: NAD-dependent epimerase/dehydratase family protein [Candidatus Altiarchaeales archaeon]|nr:NAD-dependent epimerase/dehydratase family protein [Candidatus Altiarchaeales archaeon]